MRATIEEPTRGVVLRAASLSLRFDARTVAVASGLMLAIVAVTAVALSVGEYPVALPDVVKALFSESTRPIEYVVMESRLPRVLTALLVGAALATSGAVFQSLTRNPLGSPDVIGCTQGAAAGALLVILVIGGGVVHLTIGAMAGGIASTLIVVALSYRNSLHGYRLVLVGIGLSTILLAANNFLLTRANLDRAQVAQAWLIGSVNVRGWEYVLPMSVAVAILLPLILVLSRAMATLELGDDVASALGIGTRKTRLALIMLAAILAAAATAAAGPVTFVALAAPQIARRLTRASGPVVLTSALTGALLLAASDQAAQRLFSPIQLPVGIATGAVGGVYLAWLLAMQWRSKRA